LAPTYFARRNPLIFRAQNPPYISVICSLLANCSLRLELFTPFISRPKITLVFRAAKSPLYFAPQNPPCISRRKIPLLFRAPKSPLYFAPQNPTCISRRKIPLYFAPQNPPCISRRKIPLYFAPQNPPLYFAPQNPPCISRRKSPLYFAPQNHPLGLVGSTISMLWVVLTNTEVVRFTIQTGENLCFQALTRLVFLRAGQFLLSFLIPFVFRQ